MSLVVVDNFISDMSLRLAIFLGSVVGRCLGHTVTGFEAYRLLVLSCGTS